MHALRIAHQGIELLTTGRITLPVAEPERSRLREVRSGEVALDDVLARLDLLTSQLEEITRASHLREHSDVDTVDRFVVRAYRTAWDHRRYAVETE